MKNSVKAFGDVLKKEYDDSVHVSISPSYNWFENSSGRCKLSYTLYIEGVCCKSLLTFAELKKEVKKLL
jgi:hypothetical protein